MPVGDKLHVVSASCSPYSLLWRTHCLARMMRPSLLHGILWQQCQAELSTTQSVHADLKDLLPKADIVVILVPLTPETHHLVDANFLATMKQGAMLVNAGR